MSLGGDVKPLALSPSPCHSHLMMGYIKEPTHCWKKGMGVVQCEVVHYPTRKVTDPLSIGVKSVVVSLPSLAK